MNPYYYPRYPGQPRYVGDAGKFKQLANPPTDFNPAAMGFPNEGYMAPPDPMRAAYGPPPGEYGPPGGPVRWRGPYPFSNAYSGPFDPAMVAQDMPTKLNRLPLPLGSVSIAAGAIGNLQVTIQRTFRPRKMVLVGAGATDLNVADIVSMTCAGDNLTAAGGQFPALTYANVDSLDNITADFYTAGAVYNVALLNTSGAAIVIRGTILGDTAR